MDAAITKLLFIGAAIAVSAAVVAIMWAAISSNSVDPDQDVTDYSSIKTKAVCDAAGGKWTAANTTPCAP